MTSDDDARRPGPVQPGVVDPSLIGDADGGGWRSGRRRGRVQPDPDRRPGPVVGPVEPPAPDPEPEPEPEPEYGYESMAAPAPMTPHAADRPAAPSAGTDADAREAATPPPERSARWGRVVGLFVVLAGAFLIYDSGRALLDVWRSDWVGGALLSLLALAFLAALGRAVVVEVRALRRLAEVDRVRARLERALSDDRPARLNAALDPVLALVGTRRPDLVKAFRQRRRGLEEPQAVLKQFRGAVLTPLDQEARRVVRANALAVMGATAISPHPALDVAIVLWRSAVMVRRVAEVYGLRPSALSTLLLVRQTVVSAAIAVAADPTGDMVATTLGGGLAEKVSARFAEGSISGLRALRLGGRAIEVCRPLPFRPAERKGLWHTLTQG